MNAIRMRVTLGLVLLAGFTTAMAIPQVWVKPVGDVLQIVVFGVITLDWLWLRVIEPGIENRRLRHTGI